jgi:hypothetical protein
LPRWAIAEIVAFQGRWKDRCEFANYLVFPFVSQNNESFVVGIFIEGLLIREVAYNPMQDADAVRSLG